MPRSPAKFPRSMREATGRHAYASEFEEEPAPLASLSRWLFVIVLAAAVLSVCGGR